VAGGDCTAPLPDIPCPTLPGRVDYALIMPPLSDMLLTSLALLPPGQLHARAALSLHWLGQPVPLTDWLARAEGVGRAALLCITARLAQDAAPLAEAEALAEAEWLSPEVAWSAIGSARLALGDLPGALSALTRPDTPPAPLTLPALSWLLQHLLADGGDPRPVLDHLGGGHDAEAALLGVADRDPRLAAAALGLLPPDRRDEGVITHLLRAPIPQPLPPVGPAVQVIAQARLGHTAAARARLAPLLIDRLPTWSASAPVQAAPVFHHLALACAALSDVEGALWCLERLADHHPRLRGAWRVSVLCPDERLIRWVLDQGGDDGQRVESLRQAGRIAAVIGQRQRADDLLRAAAGLAGRLEPFYPRRLALQAVSHAQIEAGAPLEALTTLDAIQPRRFGDEQRSAAAAALIIAGNIDAAMQVLTSIPDGLRRAESCCAVSAAMFPTRLGSGV
jgi:hypothetical protein